MVGCAAAWQPGVAQGESGHEEALAVLAGRVTPSTVLTRPTWPGGTGLTLTQARRAMAGRAGEQHRLLPIAEFEGGAWLALTSLTLWKLPETRPRQCSRCPHLTSCISRLRRPFLSDGRGGEALICPAKNGCSVRLLLQVDAWLPCAPPQPGCERRRLRDL